MWEDLESPRKEPDGEPAELEPPAEVEPDAEPAELEPPEEEEPDREPAADEPTAGYEAEFEEPEGTEQLHAYSEAELEELRRAANIVRKFAKARKVRKAFSDIIDKAREQFLDKKAIEAGAQDGEFYTDLALATRMGLRNDAEVIAALEVAWRVITACQRNTKLDHDLPGFGQSSSTGTLVAEDCLQRATYFLMMRKLYLIVKEMHVEDPPMADDVRIDPRDCIRAIAEDWPRDSEGQGRLSKTAFLGCWFELADVHTESVSGSDYASWVLRALGRLATYAGVACTRRFEPEEAEPQCPALAEDDPTKLTSFDMSKFGWRLDKVLLDALFEATQVKEIGRKMMLEGAFRPGRRAWEAEDLFLSQEQAIKDALVRRASGALAAFKKPPRARLSLMERAAAAPRAPPSHRRAPVVQHRHPPMMADSGSVAAIAGRRGGFIIGVHVASPDSKYVTHDLRSQRIFPPPLLPAWPSELIETFVLEDRRPSRPASSHSRLHGQGRGHRVRAASTRSFQSSAPSRASSPRSQQQPPIAAQTSQQFKRSNSYPGTIRGGGWRPPPKLWGGGLRDSAPLLIGASPVYSIVTR